ncbi:hypothetical protein C8R45DRAFT_426530 [Mycena sanguinolenta]|nr:hypothetical protein C8R45DRAFT_426530 [Mycena sanguinolenta]
MNRSPRWSLSPCRVFSPPSLLPTPFDMPPIIRRIRSKLTSDVFAARMRQVRFASDATKVVLKAIQASTDACPPLKSVVSVALVLVEMTERIKSNKAECERLAERAAQIVQDIWRQTKDFNVELSAEVQKSVAEIETLLRKIEAFFNGLEKENIWQRLARQDRHKSQVEEYGRLLDEAIWAFSINLQFSMHRLHVEHIGADEKRHDAVLSASQMSEAERLILTRIHAKISVGMHAALGIVFFLDPHWRNILAQLMSVGCQHERLCTETRPIFLYTPLDSLVPFLKHLN